MTNVSKYKLPEKQFRNLYEQFISTVASLNARSAKAFTDELLTESEKIMLIKRFSAIVMIDKGYSPYRVWTALHISPTTAQKLRRAYQRGAFENILRPLRKRQERADKIWNAIELFVRAGLPEQGKNRWKWLDEH